MKKKNLATRFLPLLLSITLVITGLVIIEDTAARSNDTTQLIDKAGASANNSAVPVIDLNGPEPNNNFATTFTEDAGSKPIVAVNMTISDADSTTLRSASVKLTNPLDGNNEYLEISTAETSLTANYDPGSGVLKLFPSDTITNYRNALSSITYNNLSDSPSTTDRLITFQVYDGANYSEQAQSIVFMEAVNDAPILETGEDFQLSDIKEDDTNQFGNRVASFIDPVETGGADRITDPDDDSLEGIAVIGVEADNGIWQFSVDAGTSWSDLTPVSESAATLLDPSARIRFIPNQDFFGTASTYFRAWDQTSGKNGSTGIDTTDNGGSSAFSLSTGIVTIEVTAVNDAPTADLNGINPGRDLVTRYLLGSGPTPIAAPEASLEDVDNEELVLVVITLQTRPNGSNEHLRSEVAATNITVTPYNPLSGQIRLIGPATLAEYNSVIRGITYDNLSDTPSLDNRIIEFNVHDGIDESPTSTTTLQLLASNNAPKLDATISMSLDDIFEDDEIPIGNSVGEIIAGAAADPIEDDEGDLRGFAVVDVGIDGGQWQYSVDAGLTWWTISTASNQRAILLNTDAKLRFLPYPDSSGFKSEISIRAWDQSAGVNGSQAMDVSENGGSSPFSVETAQISVNILAVNDAPTLDLTDGITAVFTEDNGPVNITGPSLNVTDVDSQYLHSAAIRITNHGPNEADFLDASPNGSGIAAAYDARSGVLALTGEGTVAEYQAVLRSITFENRSNDPATYDRIVTVSVSDIMTMSNIVSTTVLVESINDLPLVDLNGGDLPGNNVSIQFDQSSWGGAAVLIAENLDLHDLDDSSLIGATVTLAARPDGPAEYLAVDTDGTNITAVFNQESAQLKLTGLESIVNYEHVLRTVTYTNTQSRPLPVDRLIRFSVRDQIGKSNSATSRLVVIPKLVMLPLIAHIKATLPESDEPNNICQDAYVLNNNNRYEFLAEDRHDWYSFSTTKTADITVELTGYEPEEGQILVAEGQCGALMRIGHNGDFSTTKIIELDNLLAGTYYIWLITDNIRTDGQPFKYNLEVKVR